jgi:hypothetical protein
MTLDLDKLQGLIETLQLAKKLGFSSMSSPIEYLLEAAIDISLLLSSCMREGKMPLQDNPSLKFSERFQDELGNPKQIRFQKRKPIWWDLEAAEFLRNLASFFVVLKRRRSVPEALKSSGLLVASTQKPQEEIPEKTQKLKRTPPQPSAQLLKTRERRSKENSRKAYYRRHRKKMSNIESL